MTERAPWLRSSAATGLLAATFVVTLTLSAGFIGLHRFRDMQGAAVAPPANPMSDQQSKLQVLDAARELATAGRLKQTRASYLLMSCQNASDPPYQGAIRLNFAIPGLKDTPQYFGDMATAFTTSGWANQNPAGQTQARPTFTKDGVTAIYFADPDTAGRATMQIYGECRNVTNHRGDPTGWVDVTSQLSR